MTQKLTAAQQRMVKVWNNLAKYPLIASVATELGVSRQALETMRKRVREIDADVLILRPRVAPQPKKPAVNEPFPVELVSEVAPVVVARSDRRWIITSAVSSADVHAPFFNAIQQYAQSFNAELLVIPIRYRNPTSPEERPDDWFDPLVRPYLTTEKRQLCPMLKVMADVPTQPTAVRPLSGLHSISGEDSAIFGHPKIAYESVPIRIGSHPKAVMTTGAVTVPFYSQSKAGKKGEFHHVLAAVIVEYDGRAWHARHIHANADGSFYDLDQLHTASGIRPARVNVLALGDIHAVRVDPVAFAATIERQDSIVRRLQPRHIVLHDVLDFESGSHHNGFFDKVRLNAVGRLNVMAEIKATCALIDRVSIEAPWAVLHIVDSNHNRHFDQWLGNPKNAEDIENALVYHETKAAMIRALIAGKPFNPLAWWASQLLTNPDRVRFVAAGESLVFDGVEYGQHGDRGANGARGSLANFAKVGIKVTVGHGHGPGIMDGAYQVGTSSQLDMGYNKGSFSSWSHTHGAQYENGKRTLISIVEGEWCLVDWRKAA